MNGTFFFKTQSTTAFHYIPEMLELGFPSSKSKASRLNIKLFEDLVIRARAQGRSRRDTLALFILVWAAMDGSILKNQLVVLINDDKKMIKFFRDIIHELHEGVPYSISEYHQFSDTEHGKNIVHLTVSTPRKLCSVLLNVLSEDDKYVPPKKTAWVRRHAAAYKKMGGR